MRGLAELNRAFKQVEVGLRTDLRAGLLDAAEPVRTTAEDLAAGNIRNIGGRWSQMKKGATGRIVYVAPRARRRGGSPRPNLGGLLMREAMLPALDRRQREVERKLETLLDRLGSKAGF